MDAATDRSNRIATQLAEAGGRTRMRSQRTSRTSSAARKIGQTNRSSWRGTRQALPAPCVLRPSLAAQQVIHLLRIGT
jgi:hypothetical protein